MLTRWDPFAEIDRIESQLFRQGAPSRAAAFAPSADVIEDEGAIVIQVELPGVALADVNVGVENDLLTLSGERKIQDERFHRRERWHGAFARSFRLPRTVDVAKIEASLRDGVLVLRLPKREELRARKIEIKNAS
jgi:HSP20 family protein